MELEGTFPLPEAQARPLYAAHQARLPDEAAEEEILERHGSATRSTVELDPVVSAEGLLAAAADVDAVHFEPILRRYMLEVVRRPAVIRPSHSAPVRARASPSRTLAALRGRAFVIPDDIQEMAPRPLPHRLILSPRARRFADVMLTHSSRSSRASPSRSWTSAC